MTAWHDQPPLGGRPVRDGAPRTPASTPDDVGPETQPPDSGESVSERPAPERLMTRRELRALRERAETEAAADDAGVIEQAATIEGAEANDEEPVIPELIEPEVVELEVFEVAESEQHSASDFREQDSFDQDSRDPGADDSGPTDVQRGVEPAPALAAIPFDNWTTGMPTVDDTYDDDDDERTNSAMLGRNGGVTTGAITTHALVLPSIPESGDQLFTPLTSTGEIMVTGSIDLPRTFGSTGVHPALFDHPDVDALIDESDREDAVSDSAPVRAVRAVSSNTSTRNVIEAPWPRKSRIPLILGGAAAAAVLVATGIVAAGFIFNVF